MAVANRLSKTAQQQKKDAIAVFQANGMEVKLTPSIVKNYLVSGDKDRVTDQEVAMFINLCKCFGKGVQLVNVSLSCCFHFW